MLLYPYAGVCQAPPHVRLPASSRAGAGDTHHAVLEAARALFIERGYVATTIDAIAERANVAPETVYAVFGTKRSLLAELVDVSIAGDDEAPPILEQPWVQEMRDEPDPRRRLRMLASKGRSILERRAAVDEVVRGAAAADPEIAALWERGKAQRYAGQRAVRCGSSSARRARARDGPRDGRRHPVCHRQPRDLPPPRRRSRLERLPVRALVRRDARAPVPRPSPSASAEGARLTTSALDQERQPDGVTFAAR